LTDEDLLRPTLSDTQRVPALYNTTGFFLSAFFGGPMGAVVYGIANSYRLGRLIKDVPTLALVLTAAYYAPFVLYQHGWLQQLTTLAGGHDTRNYELFLRALGLLSFGAIYLMHRHFFRAAAVAGSKGIPGWIPGIAAVASGVLTNAAFVQWLLN
jgi:hypothetical protein